MKFEIGNEYNHTSWFTGGLMIYKVSGITDKEITFSVYDYELDGEHIRTETYDKHIDYNGNEYVILFIYSDHECRIEA